MRTRRLVVAASLAGLLGLAAVALGSESEPRRALGAYLAAHAFVTSIALGSVAFLLIAEVTGATWAVVMRRPFEAMAATLPALAVLALPLVAGLGWLYPWAASHDRAWLEPAFVVARLGACFAVWSWLAFAGRRAPAVGLIVLFVTATLAAFDALMSLDPGWSSTVLGVYWLAGGFRAALALAAIALFLLRRRDLVRVGPSHFHVLGKLLLTLVIFWAYLAYAQGFIIWIADVPRESAWLAARTRGLPGGVLAELVVTGFAVPFALLLSRDRKRRPGRLALVAALVVMAHALDAWWLVMPSLGLEATRLHWLDAAALVGLSGIALAVAALALHRLSPMPLEDPRLERSTRYVTT